MLNKSRGQTMNKMAFQVKNGLFLKERLIEVYIGLVKYVSLIKVRSMVDQKFLNFKTLIFVA